MMKKLATIKIYEASKRRLEKLAERYGKSELNYLSTSIDYIHKMGINIYSDEVQSVPDLIQKLEDRIIGFMKKREMDFFVPMSRKTQELVDSHLTFTEHLKAFDIVKFAEAEHKKNKEVPTFVISEDDNFNFNLGEETAKTTPSLQEELITEQVLTIDNSEAELLRGKVEKVEKRMERYKNELQFLMERLSKGTGLSTGKYLLNISQRDVERIQRLLED